MGTGSRTIRIGAGARRLPRGVLGMIALIAFVELGIVLRNEVRLTERIPYRWAYAGRAASGAEATGADVLCLGDSQILLGVVPSLIEERSGLTAFNLAVPGGQPPSTYVLYRRALEAGARPKTIVVGFFPGLLSINGVMNLQQWPELLDTRETMALALHAESPPLFIRVTMAHLLASTRKRDEIRARILGGLRGEPNETHQIVLAHRRNWEVNRGAQVAPADEAFVDVVGEAIQEAVPARRWRPDPVNALYIERLLTLAASRGTTVAWVMPTISPAWQSHRDASGLDDDYERYARSLLTRHPNLVVVDGRRSGYDMSAFRDAFHLERRGAAALSADLGDLVGSIAGLTDLGKDRWVELPPYSVRPVHESLEDLDQSRHALAEAETGRRLR